MDYTNLRNYAERVRSEDNGLGRRIIARLAGVTFEGRQKMLSQMDGKTLVRLERDRRNEYDFYAVKVMAKIKNRWQHVGFIPRAMSRLIAQSLDKGTPLSTEVYRVSGGMIDQYTGEQLNYGLEIVITPER